MPMLTYHRGVPADALPDQNQPKPSGHAQRIWIRWDDLSASTQGAFANLIRSPWDVQMYLLKDLQWRTHLRKIEGVSNVAVVEIGKLIDQTKMHSDRRSKKFYAAHGMLVVPSVSPSVVKDNLPEVVEANPSDNRTEGFVEPLACAVWSLWPDLSVRAMNTFGKVILGPDHIQKLLLDNPRWQDYFSGFRNVGAKTIREVDKLLQQAREMDLKPWQGAVAQVAKIESAGFMQMEKERAIQFFKNGIEFLSFRSRNVMATFLRDGGDVMDLIQSADFGLHRLLSLRNCGAKSAREIALLVRKAANASLVSRGANFDDQFLITGLSEGLIPIVERWVGLDEGSFSPESTMGRRGPATVGVCQLIRDTLCKRWDAWTEDPLLSKLGDWLSKDEDPHLEFLQWLGMSVELMCGGQGGGDGRPVRNDLVCHDRNLALWIEHRVKGTTLEEIGESVGLTRERVRQVVRKQDRQFDWESGLGTTIPEVRWVHFTDDSRILLFTEGSELRELEVEGLIRSSLMWWHSDITRFNGLEMSGAALRHFGAMIQEQQQQGGCGTDLEMTMFLGGFFGDTRMAGDVLETLRLEKLVKRHTVRRILRAKLVRFLEDYGQAFTREELLIELANFARDLEDIDAGLRKATAEGKVVSLGKRGLFMARAALGDWEEHRLL